MTSAPVVEAVSPPRAAVEHSDGELGALMVGYQQGEARAFGELFERIRPPLSAYVVSLIRDAARVDDLMQETLLQLHRSRHTYRPPQPVLPWAFGIARHVYLMDRRASGRRSKVFNEHVELPTELPVPVSAFGFADQDSLRRALGRLPDPQREVLMLHHFWGFSFLEIGRLLGIREGTAKVRSHRGMACLRELLGGTRDE